MRYFVKLDRKGIPVPNSLVFATKKPNSGRWMEIYKMCKDEECRCIPEETPNGYYQKVKYYYVTDEYCTPIPGSNISAYCLPQPGNFYEFYPPCLVNPCDQPTTTSTTTSTTSTTSTTTTTTFNINGNNSFYYAIPICLIGGGDVSCTGACNIFNSGEFPCTTFYVSPLCSIQLQIGCILYLDNTYTTQAGIMYNGYYSDGQLCYSLVNGVITNITSCPAAPTTTTTTFPHITDCTGVETVRPPVSVNGNLITSSHTGTIFEQGLGAGWGTCSGYPQPFGNNAWLGFNAFTYTIHFSSPVNNIALRIGVMGVPCDETYVFTTSAGNPTITANYSCYATITGNQITGGLGSSFGPISGGGGEFVLTTPSPYTSITITGTGECSGSLFGIVCSSI